MVQILFLAANPSDTTRLRLGAESRAIDTALRMSDFREQFNLELRYAVRFSDLRSALLQYQPHIVHFSGHGSDSDEIVLEDSEGNSAPVSTEVLSDLFETLKDRIHCVVLNACFSESQAEAIVQHVDCVIGMSQAIQDEDAIAFTSAFYEALGFGRDVKTAFELGCGAIDARNNSLDGGVRHVIPAGQRAQERRTIPQLLSANVDPAKIVFARRATAEVQVLPPLKPVATIPYTQYELADAHALPDNTYVVLHRLSIEEVHARIADWRTKRSSFWPAEIDKELLTRNLQPVFVPHWLVNAAATGKWSATIEHLTGTMETCSSCKGKGVGSNGDDCFSCDGKGFKEASKITRAVEQGGVSVSLENATIDNVAGGVPIHSCKETAEPKGSKLPGQLPADAFILYPRDIDSESAKESALQLAQGAIRERAAEIAAGLGYRYRDLEIFDVDISLRSMTTWLYPIFFGIYNFEGQSLPVEVDGVNGKVYVETPVSVKQKEEAARLTAILVSVGFALLIIALLIGERIAGS